MTDSRFHIVLISLFLIFLIGNGIYNDSTYLYYLIVVVFSFLFLSKIWVLKLIYDGKIIIKRPFRFQKRFEEISLNSCKVFNPSNGPGENNSYKLYYEVNKKYKSISISIWKDEDKELVENFFKSNGIKVNIKLPQYLN